MQASRDHTPLTWHPEEASKIGAEDTGQTLDAKSSQNSELVASMPVRKKPPDTKHRFQSV